ncbi:hypothetical protein [uncultured Ruegeria sp.]|uniref:hypothetical protein n=1 Tax=uncultured Ruegeria sp. TaxID=259304 RepID=UPI002601AA96|nr:hypothetical protein [uncultured Ruegeria sp.]
MTKTDAAYANCAGLTEEVRVRHEGSLLLRWFCCFVPDNDKVYATYRQSISKKFKFKVGSGRVSKKDVKKSTKKNSQLVLRLDKDERDAFVELCKELDTSAAREIRRFIRGFMKENAEE